MRPGEGHASQALACPLSVGTGCCHGSSFGPHYLGDPLVVCHVNSSQRGTVSTRLFRNTPPVSPICVFPSSPPPLLKLLASTDPAQCGANSVLWLRGAGGEARIPLVCVSDPSITMGRSHNGSLTPPTHFPAKLGRVNI